ncbi:MAG: hypothetical protein ACMUJM_22005 [bacterium]
MKSHSPHQSKIFSTNLSYAFGSGIDELAGAARANGFFNIYPDFDGVFRWIPLLIEYKGLFYPSMDMQIIKHFWNLSDNSILIRLGDYGIENMYIEDIPIDYPY